MYESSYAIIHKTGLYTLSHCCCMKENILSFALSPLCLVYMKFLMPSVIKLGCKRCIGWKWYVEIFRLSLKMSCLRCFCCTMKFMPSVIKLGCKRCAGWKRLVKIFLLSVEISCLRCFCCVATVSEFFFCVVDKEIDCLGCVEQICGSFRMHCEFRKTHLDKEN